MPRILSLRMRALLVVTAVGLSGCGFASADDQVVRVYTGRHYDLEVAFEAFSEQTGISVEFLEGSDAELRERILAEGEDTLADVYMTVDAGNLYLAAEQGIFQPLDSAALAAAVPASLRDPDNQWFGLTRRVRTIVYSPQRVDPARLSTYEALTDPEWAGRLCMRNSSNVYTQSLVASLIANEGYDRALQIVEAWVANDVRILGSDVLVLETIAAGGCDVGITNHYYLARILEDDPDFPVAVHFADQDGRGVHVNTSGAGVTRHADDPDLARELLEWLATDGQSAFVSGNYEYPANPDVPADPLLQEHFGDDFTADPINANDYGSLNADAIRLMAEAGYE